MEETIEPDYEPTQEGILLIVSAINILEIIEYAQFLGMDPIKDNEYL